MSDSPHDASLGADLADKLRKLEQSQPPKEYRFSLPDTWSRALFVALARRYGLRPYRQRGQRRTTVMLRTSASFVDETFWPEFLELQAELRRHLEEVTLRIIRQAVHADTDDADEQADGEPRPGGLRAPGAEADGPLSAP